MTKQKESTKELGRIIDQLKSCKSLSYIMRPVLRELEIVYENETVINNSWKQVHINEVAELIEELDEVMQETDNSTYRIYGEVMKRSTYLIDLELWIKVMELLISENQGTF